MNVWVYSKRSSLLLGLVAAILFSAPAASADLPPYELSPELSLTSDCTTNAFDPIPDPGCPYLAPPAGPTKDNCNKEGKCSSRFEEPRAITFDPYGNEYVATSGSKGWIRVFDDEGFFITEVAAHPSWSIAVDSEGNLYTFTTLGEVFRFTPSTYEPEAGNISYTTPGVELFKGDAQVGALAVDRADDHLFVAVPETIREYGPAAEVGAAEANKLIDSYEPAKLGSWTQSIAIDSQRRRIYVSYCKGKAQIDGCGILALDADNPETELEEITGATTPKGEFVAELARLGVAVDEETGDFFVQDFAVKPGAVYQFGENYEYLSSLTDSRFTTILSLQIAVSNGERPPDGSGEDAFNRHFLFIPTMPNDDSELFHRALAYEPPPEVALPPEIEAVSTAGIGKTQAQLRALIDPRGGATTYRFEITTQASFEAEGFASAKFAGEGTIAATSLPTQVSVPVSGLVPGETYRFRVSAENTIGEAAEEGQNEATFATYDDALFPSSCPASQALRVGPSARLPDCRAYELVTPPDTNGRKPQGVGVVGDVFPSLYSSPSGGKVYFRILGGSLPGSSGVASFEGDPYVTTRGAEGWSTALAGPSGDQATDGIPGSPSPDQGYSFWTASIEGPLVIEESLTHYLRYPDGDLELTGRGSIDTDPRALGKLIVQDAAHVVFQTRNVAPDLAIQIEPDAPPTGTTAVYDRTIDPLTGAEETHTVSLLPGDETPAAGQNATYIGASKDGEGIAFAVSDNPLQLGTLYLRVGNETTYEVGEEVEFAGVSEGGERIFYVEGEDLKALDTTTPEPQVIDFSTSGDVTPVNVAAEGTRAYFVSPSVEGGSNPEGDVPVPPASGQGDLGAEGTGTLSAAKGKGTLTAESKQVTGVTTDEGAFQAKMQISGTGIPAGTTINAVGLDTLTLSKPATQSGTIALAAGSTKVSALSTSQGVFQRGMQISGAGIPPETTIDAVNSSSLTLSKAATQSGVSVSLAAGSTLITDFSPTEGIFRVGMNVAGPGVSDGTIITAVDDAAHTLTISQEAEASSGSQALSAFAQNLYLSEEGQISFVATLTARDVEGKAGTDGLGLWTEVLSGQPAEDPSRLNPDGSVLLFQSRAEITGYEESEFAQIYRYDSGAERLHCLSCIPTKTPASGGATLQTVSFNSETPPPLSAVSFVPNLTPDGSRVFFESDEALVSTDTDEVQDVYEWEEQGVGGCTQAGGCLYLISSGQSERDNFLYAHSTSGDDVFFSTSDVLTGFDGGATPSIYDARVGGGFAQKETTPCVDEGCLLPLAPPPAIAPPAQSTPGNDNLQPKPASRRCPKGKRKVKKKNGKTVCVKKKKAKGGKAKQRANANRGAGK